MDERTPKDMAATMHPETMMTAGSLYQTLERLAAAGMRISLWSANMRATAGRLKSLARNPAKQIRV